MTAEVMAGGARQEAGTSLPKAEAVLAAAYWIRRVKTKLATGAYRTVPTICPCGQLDDAPICERDRYGIPHRMVLCRACGIMRANPRMTAASYREFYANEYRPIYDGWEFGSDVSNAAIFELKSLQASNFFEFIAFFDLSPEVIFDLGCNMGHLLEPFRNVGVECYGADLYEPGVNFGRQRGLDLRVGGIEVIERIGKKADLILLQQVIEHFLDPEKELRAIRDLLTPEGLLFVGTPGLYTNQLGTLFQNAHTYQFTTDSLTYLMWRAGFEEQYLDERIWSLWRRRPDDEPFDINQRPTAAAQHALAYLQGKRVGLPPIKTINKFSLPARKRNLEYALGQGFPDIEKLEGAEQGHEAIILGGGPSADQYVWKIRELQAGGGRLIAIERMTQWCRQHGIMPDYLIVMDASDDVIEAFDGALFDTRYLVATQVPPPVLDRLRAVQAEAYLFNTPQRGIEIQNYWHQHDYQRVTVLNAGGSVTLAAMSAAMCLGMKTLHVFGFDCHVTHGQYAKDIVGAGEEKRIVEVKVEDQVFKTTSSYLSFAQQFHLLKALGERVGKLDQVKVYGDSLASAMSVEEIRG